MTHQGTQVPFAQTRTIPGGIGDAVDKVGVAPGGVGERAAGFDGHPTIIGRFPGPAACLSRPVTRFRDTPVSGGGDRGTDGVVDHRECRMSETTSAISASASSAVPSSVRGVNGSASSGSAGGGPSNTAEADVVPLLTDYLDDVAARVELRLGDVAGVGITH